MPSFTFNKKTRTYSRDGRPVKPATVRQWAAEVRESAREQMEQTTARFIAGEVNRPAWTIEMRTLISRSHSAVWMLAQGGRNAMDARAWGKVGQRIKGQAEFLRGFERAVANDKAGSEAQMLARAQLYANALHSTYEAAVLDRERAAGVTRVLRVLGQPQTGHCEDCPSLAGEYDIDEVPAIGDSSCGPACYCIIESVELEEAA